MNSHYKHFKDKSQKSRNALKKYGFSLISLAILISIVSLITYYRIKIQMNIGPIWDTYDFLSDALLFAGHGIGYSDLNRPPFLPFLTSIFFRLGYISPTTIFVVDSSLFIFGIIGLFLLLKRSFNNIESFLGSLLYATFPIIISFAGVGLSDIPSVSFSIWAIYFTILAVKQNSKFFYLSFPLMMLTFLTRYPSALLIFPVVLYILINRESCEKIKDMIIGICASLLLLIPVLIFFYDIFGNPFYSFLNFFGSSSKAASTVTFAYNPNLLYFIENLPSFIGAQGIAILLIIVLSFIIYESMKFKKKPLSKIRSLTALQVNIKSTKIKLILFFALILIFLGTLGKLSWIESELLFFVLGYMSYDLSKNLKIKDMDLHLLFFAWFMTFFIFHSVYVIKDSRYFVTMAPALVYFLIFGLSNIFNRIKLKIGDINVTSYLFSIILIFMIIVSTASYLPGIQEENCNIKIMNEDMGLASQWLISYDHSYKTKIIYSDIWPCSGWYLKTNVNIMPSFKNFSQQDSMASNSFLVSSNADYYFSIIQGLNLTSYKPIKQFGNIIIYKRV